MASEDALRERLHAAAANAYGPERAAELGGRLSDLAQWLRLVEDQPLDLLDEEPDTNAS